MINNLRNINNKLRKRKFTVVNWKELNMRVLKSHPLLKLVNSYIIDSPQPSNLSYLWNFGSLLAFCLIIQIITGVTLGMHYTPSVQAAFDSVEHIMRDVNNGWLIRYLHSNTASAFFFIVYLHIGRGLYFGLYKAPRTLDFAAQYNGPAKPLAFLNAPLISGIPFNFERFWSNCKKKLTLLNITTTIIFISLSFTIRWYFVSKGLDLNFFAHYLSLYTISGTITFLLREFMDQNFLSHASSTNAGGGSGNMLVLGNKTGNPVSNIGGNTGEINLGQNHPGSLETESNNSLAKTTEVVSTGAGKFLP